MSRLWIGFTVLSVLGILLFGFLLRRRYQALREWKKDYQPPQMRFQYTADELAAEYADMGERERLLMRQFDWIFVPMLFYVGMALCVVTRNAAQYEWMAWIMHGLTLLGVLLGMAESVLLIAQSAAARAARACSLLKWILFGIWVAGMFAGLFIRSTAL